MNSMSVSDSWEFRASPDYIPPSNPTNWKECPKCGHKPRVWIFDNGRSAKCQCCERYGPPMARAESVMCHYQRCGGTEGYDCDGLLNVWNKYVDTGLIQRLLPGWW